MVKEVPIAVRDIIIQEWKNIKNTGLSQRQLAKKYNIPKSTVNMIIQKYKKTGKVDNLKGRGCKPTFDKRQTRSMIRKIKENPRLSANELSVEMERISGKGVTPSCIRKILKKEGYNAYRPRKKPYINKKNKLKRLEFARMHVNKSPRFWNRILWSDESIYRVFNTNAGQFVWRKPSEALREKNITRVVKGGGGGVLVWACMAYSGVGNIKFIDGIMDRYVYLGILEENIKDSASKLRLGKNFIFQD